MYKFNKVLSVSALALAVAISLMGCGGATTTENKTPNTTANKTTDNKATDNKSTDNKSTDNKATENKAADNTKTGGKETASGDKIGVAECDEYIEKYEMCITEKVPEAQRAMLKTSFEAQRKSFKDAAATPQGKAGLAQGCKQALEAAKASTSAWGCKW